MCATGSSSLCGKAAPAHPCARGIRASLHIIDVRGWQPPEDKTTAAIKAQESCLETVL